MADWFNNKFAPKLETSMEKDLSRQAKRQDHHRDTRTKKIQDTVSAANYMGDKNRAKAVINGAVGTTEVVVDGMAGDYLGATFKGLKLAKNTAGEVFNTADVWSDEMRKVNDWNEKYDRYGNEKVYLLI